MFGFIESGGASVTITVDGRVVQARVGDTVAVALLTAGYRAFRRIGAAQAARGPYCGIGVCFDCLVTIDGTPNCQACLVLVRPGMTIETGFSGAL
jgi:predicted molibdopterin-dependent oxidoreductase YjgC